MIVGQENFIYHGFMIATRALRSGRGLANTASRERNMRLSPADRKSVV